MEKKVYLRNWFGEGYEVCEFESSGACVDLRSLRKIDSFELYLMTLKRSESLIQDIEDMEESVEVYDTPEASWS